MRSPPVYSGGLLLFPVVNAIEVWEDEGGAAAKAAVERPIPMSGTLNQVEWAERIRRRVDAEFDNVAASLRTVAAKQPSAKLAGTEAILAILEEKRREIMRKDQAGYFIRDWQEIGDRVRRMIIEDPRYRIIKAEAAK